MNHCTFILQSNKLTLTADGSHSVFSENFQALYHSKHGAIQESKHVFVSAGLNHIAKNSINILEMGFGTGLNALMTYQSIKGININYHTLEAYPIVEAQYSELNYPTVLSLSEKQTEGFLKMHSVESGDKISILLP